MASRENNIFQLKPPPPPTVNAELLGVWAGWTKMGDREVVREAVAKGLHVDWAQLFLVTRKRLDPKETDSWFKQEVFLWVSELLVRKQVFKATHVLNNIKLDATTELTKLFASTQDVDMRDYLGNHLDNIGKLEDSYKASWRLLIVIEENRVHLNVYEKLTVEQIYEKDWDWKCEIGTHLYFLTYDSSLKQFLQPSSTWSYLLSRNYVDLLKHCINVCHLKTTNVETNECLQRHPALRDLGELCLNFRISDDMIKLLDDKSLSVPKETKEIILDECSKFGIFDEVEQNNCICILRRINRSGNIHRLQEILTREGANAEWNHFNKLLVKYCTENKLYSLLQLCTRNFTVPNELAKEINSDYLNLLIYLRDNNMYLQDSRVLREQVFKISTLLSDGNLDCFYAKNPVLLLLHLLFSDKDIDVLDVFVTKQPIELDAFCCNEELIEKVLDSLPSLASIIKRTLPQQICALTFHDLLKLHMNLDIDNLLHDVPSFSSSYLSNKFGYHKKTSFTFQLKQSRPSIACQMYLADPTKPITRVENKVQKLIALRFMDKEVASGCVAFLEMIGGSSEKIRVCVEAGNTILESGLLCDSDITTLLLKNDKSISDYLEKIQILQLDSEGFDLFFVIKSMNVSVKFCLLHNIDLPEMVLTYCASRNLWLPFLVLAQIYSYPLNQVQRLCQHFQSTTVMEHILHGVTHDIHIDDAKSLIMRDRDSRKYYLSKVGVRQSLQEGNMSDSIYSSSTSIHSISSVTSSSGSCDGCDYEMVGCKVDLLQTLIRCHNSADPPKALLQACCCYNHPLLAVLATCYEPDSIVTNWLTWITVSCGIDTSYFDFDIHILTADLVKNVLVRAMRNNHHRALYESFLIFLTDNPLKIFLEFLNGVIESDFDVEVLAKKCYLFGRELQRRKSSTLLKDDHEMFYLCNRTWLEKTAMSLLATALQYSFTNSYDQLRCLHVVNEVKLSSHFLISVPNFGVIYQMVQSLFETSRCDITLDLSLICDSQSFRNEVYACLDKLVNLNRYDCARSIAHSMEIQADFIVIRQWQSKFECKENQYSIDFWEACNDTFEAAEIEAPLAVKFFESCADTMNNSSEKYEILKLAHKWASRHYLSNKYEIEKRMWLVYFSLHHDSVSFEMRGWRPPKMLYSQIKENLEILQKNNGNSHDLDSEEIIHLDKTINKLLDIGDVWQALRLSNMFHHENENLNVIILCYSLAEGMLMPYELTAKQRIIVNKTDHIKSQGHRRRRPILSPRISTSSLLSPNISPSMITSIPEESDNISNDTTVILETLSDRVKHGAEIVQSIWAIYRISVNTGKTYQSIFLCTNAMEMLKQVLESSCKNKLDVVSDFSIVFHWSKEVVSEFLCETLVITITKHVKLKVDSITVWDLRLDVDFHLFLQLLGDNCSILGSRLYVYADAIHKLQTDSETGKKLNEGDLHLVVELLILSHDCFTADCNMEGISTVLRKCQAITSLLLTLESWRLIVRMLTGVGRYTEMVYVFHILRDNDQFEFLLCKGSRRNNVLKIALLNYLKKYCPENKELYRMVALHFTLFSEIALLWEQEAESIVRNLIAISKLEMQNNELDPETEPFISFMNTDGTKICLNKIMVNYTHATEYHLQGEKLASAQKSSKQAELVALQMSLLKGLPSSGMCICLFNLSSAQIATLISTELSFSQTLIVIEAYEHPADWVSVLFEQYLLRSKTQYFNDFMNYFSLTDVLVHDLSRRFLSASLPRESTVKNMKRILRKCRSVRTRYRIASELGFSDIIEDLLAGNELAYLKDTVWKKGYKS